MNEQSIESLEKEYQATQDMIKHYDDLTMRFGATTQSGVLIFIGLAFGLLSKEKEMFLYLFPFVILFVVSINLFVSSWFQRHRSISQYKIQRILEIEKQIGWKQFTLVDEAFKANKITSTAVRNILKIYFWTMPITLMIAYSIVICFS